MDQPLILLPEHTGPPINKQTSKCHDIKSELGSIKSDIGSIPGWESENILPVPIGHQTQVAGSTGNHSTTFL